MGCGCCARNLPNACRSTCFPSSALRMCNIRDACGHRRTCLAAAQVGWFELQNLRDWYRVACGQHGMRRDLVLRFIDVRAPSATRPCSGSGNRSHGCTRSFHGPAMSLRLWPDVDISRSWRSRRLVNVLGCVFSDSPFLTWQRLQGRRPKIRDGGSSAALQGHPILVERTRNRPLCAHHCASTRAAA